MSIDNNKLFELFSKEFNKINHQLENMNHRLDKAENRLDNIEIRLDNMDKRLDNMEIRLDKLEEHYEVLKIKQDKTNAKLEDLQLDIKLFERNVKHDIHMLQDATETIEQILKLNNLIPVFAPNKQYKTKSCCPFCNNSLSIDCFYLFKIYYFPYLS